MTSLDDILSKAASGMSADSIRMNLISSNLANANTVGSSEDATYRSKSPVFSEITNAIPGISDGEQAIGGVRVTDIQTKNAPLQKHYDPTNPMANKDGYVFTTDVNSIEEMTNMIEASRSYQANTEVMNTTKSLIMQTINVIASK